MVINTTGKVRVFVYGSLKRGHPNNVVLKSCTGAQCIGVDYIEGKFDLLDFGPFPALAWDDDVKGDNKVYGEVWAGDEEMLAACDLLEGHPTFYKRQKVWTKLNEVRAWVYVINNDWRDEADDIVTSGLWHPTDNELKVWKAKGIDHAVAA
jgi:gamma-glutamylcyclotransferase (GGCT)/AIG2-like uncharacterized protein YtfP